MRTKSLSNISTATLFLFVLLAFVVTINAQTINKNKPTANAGENQFAHTNTVVKLNASNSTDIDGNRLSYQWQILSKPASSQAKLDNNTKITPFLPIDVAGSYQIELLVSDGQYQSSSLVEVNTEETSPIIPKIYDKKALREEVTDLSADNAYDPDGDNLTFSWQLLNKPSQSKAHITDGNQSNAFIITDKVGRYLVRLNVSDGKTSRNQLVNIISVDNLLPPNNKNTTHKNTNGIQCILDRIFLNGFEVNGTSPSMNNSQPVANIGEDQLGVLGQQMQLDGSLSFDLDFDVLTYQWSLLSAPTNSSATIANPTQMMATFTPDIVGDYVVQLVVDDNICGSNPDSALMTISVNQQPIITSIAQTQATENRSYSYQVVASDPENHSLTYALTIAPAGMTIDADGLITWTALTANTYAVIVNVTDAYGAQVTQSFDIVVGINQAPVIESYPISSGEKDFSYSYQLSVSDFEGDAINYALINPPTGMTISASGLISWLPDTIGSYPIQVQVDDGTSATDTQSYNLEIIALPPNPNDIAPPLSKTEYTPFLETISFLYQNNPPVQVGMPVNTIEDYRVAVITGKVLDEDNNPIRGIKVTINNHDEYGYTYTRDNGIFFMVVNGGGTVTVNFDKGGYLPVQRDVKTPWQEFAYVDDLIIVKLDDKVTAIDLTNTTQPYQVAQGNVVTDMDGTRQATVLFPAGITATMTMPDGTTQSIDQLDVRATEYTVGENGPQKMPADLPTGSAYTYAVELSVDQALDSNAIRVNFNSDILFYLDNFLGFPAGVTVPIGWYEKSNAIWIPKDDGIILKIIDIIDGKAVVDITNDNLVNSATPQKLLEYGISDAELSELAKLYPINYSVWRTKVSHFTAYDCNFPFTLPEDVQLQIPDQPSNLGDSEFDDNADKDEKDEKDDNTDDCDGCNINAQNRTLEEKIEIIGTNTTLKYRSEKIKLLLSGIDSYTIPLTNSATIPDSLDEVELFYSLNNSPQTIHYNAESNLTKTIVWDGKDHFGRDVFETKLNYTIRYRYPLRYSYILNGDERTFRQFYGYEAAQNMELSIRRSNLVQYRILLNSVTLRRHHLKVTNIGGNKNKGTPQLELNGMKEEQLKLGGWGITNHHVFDPKENILFQGDGFQRAVAPSGGIIGIIPQGTPSYGHAGNATAATAGTPEAIATAPNGDVYFSDTNNKLIRKVTPDGTIFTVAGGSPDVACTFEEVQNAMNVCLQFVTALYVHENGEIYYGNKARVRKISLNGVVTTVAGTGNHGFNGDNIQAINANIDPRDIIFDKNGNLYILEADRLRVVDNNGIIKTIAGNDDFVFPPPPVANGVIGTESKLLNAKKITISDDGSIYIADSGHKCVRHMTPDGYIYKFFSSNDCVAEEFRGLYPEPLDIALDESGNLFVLDSYGVVNKSYPFGLSEIFNDNISGFSGDGGDFSLAKMNQPLAIEFSKNSGLLIADTYNYRIRKISQDNIINTFIGSGEITSLNKVQSTYLNGANPEKNIRNKGSANNIFIASRDGSLLYEFSKNGVHLKTIDAITAKVYLQFIYNSEGILTEIIGQNQLSTIINRDASNKAISIVSPYGKTTLLEYFTDGRLKTVTDPNLNHWDMEYTQCLLTSFTDRNSNRYEYTYDGFGRLISDLNPIGGGWQLSSSTTLTGRKQTIMTTGEGREYVFETIRGDLDKFNPDGTVVEKAYIDDGDVYISEHGAGGFAGVNLDYRSTSGVHERLGNQVRFAKTTRVKTDNGISLQKDTINTLVETLVTPDTLAPVSKSVLTSTINGQNWVSEFNQVIGANRGYKYTTPEGRLSTRFLNDNLDVKSVTTSGFLPTEISYDANRRVQNIAIGTGVDKRETVLTYYNSGTMNGELQTITNAIGQTASFEYDNNGRISKQIMPDLREIIYTYDANGNLKSLTPPGRPVHNFDYNGMDQETQYTPPDLPAIPVEQTQYTYNLDEQITQITRPDGQIITLNYNATTGKMASKITPTGTYSYAYDATTGKLNHITSPAGITLDYTFDGFLPLSTTWSGNQTGSVSRTYDNLFRVTSRTVNGTDTINYGYDNDNLLTTAGAMTISREVQKGGIINGTTLGNVTTSNTFSDFAELATYNAQYSGADIYDVAYTRDKIGRITTKTETLNGTTTVYDYVYDLTGRLIEEKTNNVITGTWTYDLNGNRTHVNGVQVATYDDQDRLLTYQGNTYTYTDNGELLTKTNGTDVTTYDYDVLGNLLSVTKPDGTLIEYLIDPRGRRVGKKVNGILIKGWLYKDKLNPIAELDASANIITRFIYGDRGNIPSYMVKGGVTYRIITNQLGSPIKIIDTTTGAIAQEMSYDVWGSVLTDSNPDFQPFGFAGGIYDGDTGLTRFGYRDYDAGSSRWTSKDPIEFKGGDGSLYSYVTSDPINAFDPNGLSKFDKLFGLPKDFWKWYHRKVKKNGDPDLDADDARYYHEEWKDKGKPGPDSKRNNKEKGEANLDLLEWLIPWPFLVSPLGCSTMDCYYEDHPDEKPIENPEETNDNQDPC